jgi:hypothetical protein
MNCICFKEKISNIECTFEKIICNNAAYYCSYNGTLQVDNIDFYDDFLIIQNIKIRYVDIIIDDHILYAKVINKPCEGSLISITYYTIKFNNITKDLSKHLSTIKCCL